MAYGSASKALETDKRREHEGKLKAAGDAAEERAQLEDRQAIRAECESILLGGVARKKVMIGRDVDDYMEAWTEDKLEWADTHGKKVKALQEAVRWARDFVMVKAEGVSDDFLGEVKRAKGKEWTENVKKRWAPRTGEIRKNVSFDHAPEELRRFVRTELNRMEENWKKLRQDLDAIDMLRARFGATSKDVPELAALDAVGFDEDKFPARREAASKALHALRNRSPDAAELADLRDEAVELLESAAAAGFLDASKVSRALKSIFTKDKTLAEIRVYVQETLPKYRADWVTEAAALDELADRGEALATPVRPLPKPTYFALSYAERTAYRTAMESRLTRAEEADARAAAAKAYIHKSIDAGRYDQARELLKKAEAAHPDDKDLPALATLLASPALQGKEAGERDPIEVRDAMRSRVASLPAGVQTLYAQALEADTKTEGQEEPLHMLCVEAMMDNGAIMAERAAVAVRPEATQEEANVERVERAEGDAVTAGKKATVIYMGSDEASQKAVFEKIERGKTNADFVLGTALNVNVPPETRTQLAGGMNEHLARDARYLRKQGIPFTMHENEAPRQLAA